MCRYGVRTGSPDGDVGPQLVRKPTQRASSVVEVLKRTCLRGNNELGPEAGGARQRGILQGGAASGANRAAEAA
eukprot:4517807-Alexandrium_andersonii.AAC.1